VTYRRIIVPVTLATDSLEGAAAAAELAARLDAELILAGVAPLVPSGPLADWASVGETPQRQVEEQQLLDRILTERLAEVGDALTDGVRWRSVISWGPVGPALVEAARDERADLIVVPIRREPELAHLVHDHADRYVLHHSDVPVLVVPTNGARHGTDARADGAGGLG
jgi:nucleotide-binding universal stress UspA family protein